MEDVYKARRMGLGSMGVRQGSRGCPYGSTQNQARKDTSPGVNWRYVLSLRDFLSNRGRDEAISTDDWAC